jgi:hypothetical protein
MGKEILYTIEDNKKHEHPSLSVIGQRRQNMEPNFLLPISICKEAVEEVGLGIL